MTELTLRLYGMPEAISAAVCPFDGMEGAVQTVITTIQLGIPVARIELLDALQMEWRSVRLKKDPACKVCGAGQPR